MSEEVIFRRSELYDLVWAEPLTTLSVRFNVSDYELRKVCNKMQIPLPKAGHWMKLDAGKKVYQETLPSEYDGLAQISLQCLQGGEDYKKSLFKYLQIEIEEANRLNLPVPPKLINPDPLIVEAKKSLSEKHKSYNFIGMITTSRNVLDIRVSPNNVDSALRFMDSLIKVFRSRGHSITVDSDGTYATIKGDKINIGYKEKSKRVIINDRSFGNSEYRATGITYFKTSGYHSAEWVDGKKPLEEQIPAILAKLEMSVDNLHEIQEEHQRHFKMLRDEEDKIISIQQRKQKELSDFKTLLNAAIRSQQSILIRNYLKEVEEKAVVEGYSIEFQNWLTWAKAKTDWYDPLIERDDELLREVDKETLSFKKKDE